MTQTLRLTPSMDGWVTKATAAMADGHGVTITVSGAVANEVMARVVRHSVGLLGRGSLAADAVAKLLGQAPVPVSIDTLVAIGALGGMVATVATVAALGASKGRAVSITWSLNAPFDVTDDEMHVHIQGAAP